MQFSITLRRYVPLALGALMVAMPFVVRGQSSPITVPGATISGTEAFGYLSSMSALPDAATYSIFSGTPFVQEVKSAGTGIFFEFNGTASVGATTIDLPSPSDSSEGGSLSSYGEDPFGGIGQQASNPGENPAGTTIPLPCPPSQPYLTANPQKVASGGTSMLTWAESDTGDVCTASGGWSGDKDPTGGTQQVGPLSSDTAYTITCSNPTYCGSDSSSASVTVGVSQAAATNRAPLPPTITADSTNLNFSGVGNRQTYYIQTTDPDGDDIYYEIKDPEHYLSDQDTYVIPSIYTGASSAYDSSGTRETFPYQWRTSGQKTITARAVDTFGAASDWATLDVTLTPYDAQAPNPTVVVTSPADGSTVSVGTPVTITAVPSISSGSIKQVDFSVHQYYTNDMYNAADTATRLAWQAGTYEPVPSTVGTITSSPYSISWTPPWYGTGRYLITARAISNLGKGSLNDPSITVNVARPSANQPVPVITASPSSLSVGGGATTVTWSSTNASSCTESDNGLVLQLSESSLSGSRTLTLSNTTTFTMTCSGSLFWFGGPQSSAATVTVAAPSSVCTDTSASNYGGAAPCTFTVSTICTDPSAINYNGAMPCAFPPTDSGFDLAASPSTATMKIYSYAPAVVSPITVSVYPKGSFSAPITLSASAAVPSGVSVRLEFLPSVPETAAAGDLPSSVMSHMSFLHPDSTDGTIMTYGSGGYAPTVLHATFTGQTDLLRTLPIRLDITGTGGGYTSQTSVMIQPIGVDSSYKEI